MKATYCKSGNNYQPVIVHNDGNRETLWGDPLATQRDAIKFAQLEINDRRHCQEKRTIAAKSADGRQMVIIAQVKHTTLYY